MRGVRLVVFWVGILRRMWPHFGRMLSVAVEKYEEMGPGPEEGGWLGYWLWLVCWPGLVVVSLSCRYVGCT
jgi:hypothetical protein